MIIVTSVASLVISMLLVVKAQKTNTRDIKHNNESNVNPEIGEECNSQVAFVFLLEEFRFFLISGK